MIAVQSRRAWNTGAAALATLALAMLLIACQGTNPVQPALESKRPDLIAYALESSYVIVQGKALEVVRQPGTPQSVKDAVARIDAKANPILDAMRPLAEEAAALKESLGEVEGADEEERLRARLAFVLNELDRLVTEVSPLISELVAAIKGD